MLKSHRTAIRLIPAVFLLSVSPGRGDAADYQLELAPEFRSNLQVADIINTALRELARPIENLRVRNDEVVDIEPTTPRVQRVLGCIAERCAAMIGGRAVFPVGDPNQHLWVVIARGDYSTPRFFLRDHIGFIIIDAISGEPFGAGFIGPATPLSTE